MATSFSGGRSRREPPTMGKQLVNFITCGCASSAPFFVIYKAGCEPTLYWWVSLVSFTNKANHHDITEILIKVELNTITMKKTTNV
jgi:hypothetical protein